MKKHMNYIEIKIQGITAQQAEEIIALLAGIDFSGFEENDSELKAFIDEAKFNAEEVKQVLQPYALPFTQKQIPQQNWNALWEANFEPIVIGDFVGIRAGFHQPIQHVQHEIIITPKMSFGTGHHATTYMVMQLMRDVDFNNKTVFDFGTGTGILAILAEKLGASAIIAGDNDDICVENAQENIVQNACQNITVQKIHSAGQGQAFDVVLANINRNIILENVENLASISKFNTIVLLSGLLKNDEMVVLEAMVKAGFQHIKTIERAGWIAVEMVRA